MKARRGVLFALLAAFLMLASALVVAAPLNAGTAAPAPAVAAQISEALSHGTKAAEASALGSGSAFDSLASTVLTGGAHAVTGAEEEAVGAEMLGPTYGYLASEVSMSAWGSLASFVASGGNAHLLPAGIPLEGLLTIGGLAALAAICAASAGIGCAIAFVVVAVVALVAEYICPISNFFGSNYGCSSPSGQQAAIGTGVLIMSKANQAAQIQAVATTNLLNALNGTANALGYEAAAAALPLLSSPTFDFDQDEVGSGVAQQLGSVFWADAESLASIENALITDMDYYEGAGDGVGYTCPLYIPTNGGPEFNLPTFSGDSSTVLTCGSGFSGTAELAYGQLFGVWGATPLEGTNPTVSATGGGAWFLGPDSSLSGITGTSGTTTYSFTSVNLTQSASFNLTVSDAVGGEFYFENYSVPSATALGVGTNGGGYSISTPALGGEGPCGDESSCAPIFVDDGFPLGPAAVLPTGGEPQIIWDAGASLPSNAANEAGIITQPFASGEQGLNCLAKYDGGNVYSCAENLDGNVSQFSLYEGAGAQLNLGSYLVALAARAVAMGQTYYAFLRYDLGYTSASEVPADCLIPSPSQLLPPNLDYQDMEGLNETSYLSLYMAELNALGKTFANASLTSSTICGKHPVWNPDNETGFAFGEYGAGYIYVPNATGTDTVPAPPSYESTTSSAAAGEPSTDTVAVVAGDLMVLEATAYATQATVPTDSQSNTWTQLGSEETTDDRTWENVFYAYASATGNDVISVTNVITEDEESVVVLSGVHTAPISLIDYTACSATPCSVSWTGGAGDTAFVLGLSGITVSGYGGLASIGTYPEGWTNLSYGDVGAGGTMAEMSVGDLGSTPASGSASFAVNGVATDGLVLFVVLIPDGVGHPEIFGEPSTWAYSGLIYLGPTVASLGLIEVNETFLLGDANPVNAFVSPFMEPAPDTNGTQRVNTGGPEYCPFGHMNASNCDQTPLELTFLSDLLGNSSIDSGLSGSTYPEGKTAPVGVAVYLTACYQVVNDSSASNPTYARTSTCQFSEERINDTAWTCEGSVLIEDGQVVGSCSVGPPVLVPTGANGCGGVYLNWLAGPIDSLLGFFGPFACPISEVAALLIILVVVILVIYLIAGLVRRREMSS